MKRSFLVPISGLWLLTTGLSHAILDTNNNGLSDLWERQFNNGSLFDESFDPQTDPDSDGWTNAQEAEAGTNPFDPNPPDGLISPATAHIPEQWSEPYDEYDEPYLISPETVTVTWPTLAGKQYTLFFSPDLTQGSWLPVGSPFIAYGGQSTYGFAISQAGKCFWRVSVQDTDADSDGLTNREESLAGTNPALSDTDGDTLSDHAELVAGTDPRRADADGDGWTDPQELAAGTDSRNQDTDGDGIPDSVDTQPLASAFAFADADGDGIPDGDDPAPSDPRGPAPSIASENASGNPLCNLIEGETVKLALTVGNPGGPAPTAPDLTFFLNGTGAATTITATGSPVGSSQRFLLTWTAKTTANYPALTLQNLTLRFRDSQQATTWIRLARIDVAEWEGMVAAIQAGQPSDSWQAAIRSHSQGVYGNPTHLAYSNGGGSTWYRGPRTVPVHRSGASPADTSFYIAAGMRYPLVFISRTGSGPLGIHSVADIADPEAYPHEGIWYHNSWTKDIKVSRPPSDEVVGIGTSKHHPMPEETETSHLIYVTLAYQNGQNGQDDWKTFYGTNWPVHTAQRSRRTYSMTFQTTATGQVKINAPGAYLNTEATIVPHAAGTLEIPGLPLPGSSYHTRSTLPATYPSGGGSTALLPIGQGAWHKIVLRVGPDAAAISNGIGLWLRKGAYGDAAPQGGFTLKLAGDNEALEDLPVPADGKITLAADSPNWQRLTSPEGLTLFVQRDDAVTDIHDLSLQLLKKREWYAQDAVRIATLNLLPVEVKEVWSNQIADVEVNGHLHQAKV